MSELTVTSNNVDQLLKSVKRELSKGFPLRVIIEPIFTQRTKNQNAYYHALVRRIALQCGAEGKQGLEFVSQEVKKLATSMGYPFERDEHGELVTDERGLPIPLSSSKASISQMKVLIEACFRLAQEYNFILEDER